MKNKLILPVVGLMVSILGGCGQSAGEIAEIVSERDSLRNLSKRQERRLERLDDIVEIVNGSLDSIVTEEGNLFISGSVTIESRLPLTISTMSSSLSSLRS